MWGVVDSTDGAWFGDEHGPVVFEDRDLARVAAAMTNVACGWEPGRAEAREFPDDIKLVRGADVPKQMSDEEALKRLEDGRAMG